MTTTDARKRHTENTTPKETPVTKHPETTTEWLEDIALELHAITGLLNERLPVVHPGGQSNELNNDDPDEALAKVLYDTECGSEGVTWGTAGAIAKDTYRDLARAAREHIAEEGPLAGELDAAVWHRQFEKEKARAEKAEAERDGWEAAYMRVVDLLSRTRDERDKAECERDASRHAGEALAADRERLGRERNEWKAKFEQTDTLLSRTRDERDVALANQQASDTALAEALDRWSEWRKRHAALREDVDFERRGGTNEHTAAVLRLILRRDDERGQS